MEKLRIFWHGAKMHPGNILYLICFMGCIFMGAKNPEIPWWSGFTSLAILSPLYILTAYSVGRANWKD